MSAGNAFTRLVDIMARLRSPGGCPWDLEQTHTSIKPYLIEEAYEVAEAIDDEDADELCKELGDLLLQVVFHARIADEAGNFDIDQVVTAINEKMVRRHPHVFGDDNVKDAEHVLDNWALIKAQERKDAKKQDQSELAGVPRALPALLRAHRLGEKAGRAGFDWPDVSGVLDKVEEELAEVRAAIDAGDTVATEAEVGDLLMSVASLARHTGCHAEDALQKANDRFVGRFRHIETKLGERRRDIRETSLDELEELWQDAKRSRG